MAKKHLKIYNYLTNFIISIKINYVNIPIVSSL